MDFKVEIAKLISNICTDLTSKEIEQMIEAPSNSDMGDYAFPCFKLARIFKKSPNIIAQELACKIDKVDFIQKVEVVSAYINFFINKSIYAKIVIENILNKKEKFGYRNIGNNKNIVVDYSSPNIAKPFHVGHLRSTTIGNAICNIYKSLGYNVYGINHLGDWGTQFGRLIVAYKNWGNKELIEQNGVQELMEIYVKFHEEEEKDSTLTDEARAWFVKMQDGDKEALDLWKWFYDISMKEFEKVYKRLGVNFDFYTGESFYNDKMDATVLELKSKNLLKQSEGAQVVDLSEFNMPPCLIIRSDGGTLYATRDITAAIYRKNEFSFDKCLYITALDQNLHFSQWFKVIEKMGYDWYNKLVHVPFGLVSLESGKLSTRKGNVVLMEELLNEAVQKTRNIIEQKSPDLQDKDIVAEQVGIGAVIFNDLYNSRIKDVVFSWDKMLNFDGETGPYVQYTHARACSVIRKAQIDIDSNIDFNVLEDSYSIEVLKLLNQFPSKIEEAANKYEPYIITRHIVDISQSFNNFYNINHVIVDDKNIKKARLALVYCVKTVLSIGLKLLGIKSPERM